MINVSDEFKTLMQQRTDFKCNAVVTFTNGTVLELNESVFTLNNNSITDGADATGFPLGVAISRTIQIELLNDKDQYASYDFFGAKIRLYLTFKLSQTVEKIEMGTFTVIDPETYGETVIITAQDDMYKTDTPYKTTLSYPSTLSAMFREICGNCGLAFVTAAFTNNDFTVSAAPSGDLTNRQVLGYIAMIAGGNARINRSGVLEIITYKSLELLQHDVQSFINLNVSTTDIIITGLKTISFAGDYESEEITYTHGSEGYMLSLENPLFAGREQEALSLIAPYVLNYRFSRFEGDVPANPTFEFMDTIIFKDRKGKFYGSWITDVNFVFGGITTIKNTAEPALRNNASYVVPETQAVIAAKKLVEKEKTARELAVQLLNQKLATASGMYSTDEKQPDGSTIHYLHDKPTLAESTNVIKVTAEAIGFSTNGGATYPFGIEISGDVITKILSAEGVNADWINVGALTAKNAAGETVFKVDVDTGEVTINGTNGNVNFQNCPFSTSYSRRFYATDYDSNDLNAMVDIMDGKIAVTDENLNKYDVNGDGIIGILDYYAIKEMIDGVFAWRGFSWHVEITPENRDGCLRVYRTLERDDGFVATTTDVFAVGASGVKTLQLDGNIELNDNTILKNGGEAFAPTGYGLGGNSVYIDDVHKIDGSGFFYTNENTRNAPYGLNYCTILARKRTSDDLVLEAIDVVYGSILIKVCVAGNWQPWEWVNPPMELGVEYRTTERFDGKPVYTKQINCGTFPSASTKIVSLSGMNIDQVISCIGNTTYSGASLPSTTFSNGTTYIDANVEATRNAIIVNCRLTFWTEYTCYAILKYTKTTD